MADWNDRYRRGEHADEGPDPLVVRIASTLSPGTALDVACGAGRHSIWLAEHGWQVTAVDSSTAALEIVQKRSREKLLAIDCRLADLERHEFAIKPEGYDLIVVWNYLQRDFFEAIKGGTRFGGAIIASIPMVDDHPNVKPMNPAYLVLPGELRAQFPGWQLLHDFEGKPNQNSPRRAAAQIVARRAIP